MQVSLKSLILKSFPILKNFLLSTCIPSVQVTFECMDLKEPGKLHVE